MRQKNIFHDFWDTHCNSVLLPHEFNIWKSCHLVLLFLVFVSHAYHGWKVTEAAFFFKIWNITQIKKALGDHWFCRSFWEFCVPPPLVCKVETFHCLWTTVMRICLIRATLHEARSDSLLGRGMVVTSYMLRHVWAEVTCWLHLSCHWMCVREDLLTSVVSWTNIKSVLLYAYETWKTTNQITRRLQIFVNKCLRRIMNIKWTDKITNKEVNRKSDKKKKMDWTHIT